MSLPRTATDEINDPVRELILNNLERARHNLHTLRLDRADAQSSLDAVDLAILQTESRISAFEAWLAENP